MPGTRLVNRRDLARQYELERDRCVRHITESLEAGDLKPRDFSIAEIFEATLGRETMETLRTKGGRTTALSHIVEADSVRYADFSSITGQILFTEMKEAYESPEFVFTKLIDSEKSEFQEMEKIPGMSRIGDESEVVAEGENYPRVGPSEDYIHYPFKKKRGEVCEVTKEAVLGDRTGMLLQRCKDLGWGMGLNLEKRVIDALIDENGGAVSAELGGHRYHWRNTTYGSYQTASPWINVATSNGLTTDVNLRAAWQLLMDMRDPYTGEPILLTPDTLICCTDNLWVAKSILRTVETRHDTNQSAGTASRVMLFPNPVSDNIPNLKVVTSQYLDDRAALDTDWWLGSPKKMVKRIYIWDLDQEEAPTNHYDMFQRDILHETKTSVMDCIATIEPRAMTENRA